MLIFVIGELMNTTSYFYLMKGHAMISCKAKYHL